MSVHAWGGGASGAVGTGALKDELLPAVVEGALRGKHVVGVSCGELHSLAVDDLGNVYGWGRNREGQAGVGALSAHVPAPTRVAALAQERVTKVVAGSHQSLAITDDGRLYRWGLFHVKRPDMQATPAFFGLTDLNQLGEAGRSMVERSQYLYFANRMAEDAVDDEMQAEVNTVGAFRRVRIHTPELVSLPPECGPVVDAAIGYCFSLIATADGTLFVFGFNDKGQLGLGDRFTRELPTRVASLAPHKIVGVAAGQQHAAAVSDAGHLFTWGGGVFGIGHGDGADVLLPRRVEGVLASVDVASVACGAHHTFCLARDGRVFSFGHGEYGQQGTGDFGSVGERSHNVQLPREFFLPSETAWGGRLAAGARPALPRAAARVQSVACGHLHTLFRTSDGAVWSCGWGVDGVLGHGDKKYRAVPAPIRALEGEQVTVAAAGWRHNLVVKAHSSTFALDFLQRTRTGRVAGVVRVRAPEDLALTLCSWQPRARCIYAMAVLSSGLLSDVTFVVEGKPIRAHRVFVAARCPRLAAMLAFHRRFCAPQLVPADVLPLRGVRFVAFQAFLAYLYTDHLKIARFFLPDVRAIAQTFCVPRTRERRSRLDALCQQQLEGEHGVVVVPPSTFAVDMGARVADETEADVYFQLGPDVTIPAHKALLARPVPAQALLIARSEYFRSMLNPDVGFSDARSPVIALDGCPFEPETFRAVLRHLYTGERDVVPDEHALDLLSAANYLMLDDLKQSAEDQIGRAATELVPADDTEAWQSYADAASALQAVRLAALCSKMLAG